MKHKKWSADTWAMMSFNDLLAEHNDLFEAWRKAETRVMETMDENNRLDRELDEARQALRSPIRVPFSDAQIEAMAKACCDKWNHEGMYDLIGPNIKRVWQDCIRAALAAGGRVMADFFREVFDRHHDATHELLRKFLSAPAQEEKEEMERNDKGQMICDHCKEPITLTGAGETWVNADPKAYHRKCHRKAVTEPARQLHRDATLAVLSGLSTKPGYHTWADLISDVNAIANEFVRQYNPDAAINEAVRRWDEMRGEQ